MIPHKNVHEYITDLGRKIKLYRVAKGLSQQDMEDITGVSKRSISRLEQGQSIQLDNLFKILIALEVAENIDVLVPDQAKRPSFYFERSANKQVRVKRKKIRVSSFKWGDES